MKKAIAPLIATVILVGFAVALAAIVIDWNIGFYRDTELKTETESATRLDCTFDLDIRVSNIRGIQQICFNNETRMVELTIENAMQEKIDSVKVRVLTNESVIGPTNMISVSGGNVTEVMGGGAVKAMVEVPEGQVIKEVAIIPGLNILGEIRLCGDSLISIPGPLNDCNLI